MQYFVRKQLHISIPPIAYDRANVRDFTYLKCAYGSNIENSGLTPPKKAICQIQNEGMIEETPQRFSREWPRYLWLNVRYQPRAVARLCPKYAERSRISVWWSIRTARYLKAPLLDLEKLLRMQPGETSLWRWYMGQEPLKQRTKCCTVRRRCKTAHLCHFVTQNAVMISVQEKRFARMIKHINKRSIVPPPSPTQHEYEDGIRRIFNLRYYCRARQGRGEASLLNFTPALTSLGLPDGPR